MSPDDSHVLVTGASGFVGANIVKYLAQRKRRVLGTTRTPGGPDPLTKDFLKGLEAYIDWIEVDLTDYERMMSMADRCKLNGIVHAAVFTAVTKEVEQARPKEILSSNLMGTVNTLELARKAGVKRFVYVSSSGLYGSTPDSTTPVTEDSPQPYLRMSGFYSITKIASEKMTERYSQLFPMTTTSMRIAAPYGCMERPTRSRNVMGPIFRLLKLILTDKKTMIRVKGLGYARDWTYAMDTAEGLVAGLDATGPISPVYNVSCGVNSSLTDILNAIQGVPGVSFEWKEVGEEADLVGGTGVGAMRGPLGIEKTRRELGFSPQYDLRRGIREYCEWWKSATEKGLMTFQ
jgi:UDP-glucose 4-epimerase